MTHRLKIDCDTGDGIVLMVIQGQRFSSLSLSEPQNELANIHLDADACFELAIEMIRESARLRKVSPASVAKMILESFR